MTDVKVNNIKVDIGAEVMAISESTLQTLGQLEVNMPDKKLYLNGHTYRNFERRTVNTRLSKGETTINDRHRVRPLDPLLPDTPVWIRTEQSETTGHIQSPAIYQDPTLSPLQMAKSLEELNNTLHPGHQYRHFPALEFQ